MKFTVHTYGCQMNVRDSEIVTALLLATGHHLATHEDEAELVIVNSCSVRSKAEDKALGKLGLMCATKRERPTRIVGLMGCMAQRLEGQIFKLLPQLDFAVGTRCAGVIPHLVQRVQAGESNLLECPTPAEAPEELNAHITPGFSAFVTILLGCNRRCTYCIVPDVRGMEYSRPAREIIAEIETLARNGVREVTLLGQSVMNYGLRNPVWFDDDAPSALGFQEAFTRLLEAVAAIPEIARIRFTSGHPSGVTAELVEAFKVLPSLCPHLHLPAQSGSDHILKAMRRGYTRDQYLNAVRALRGVAPHFALTTDIIVGFPGETAADFEATRELMQLVDFDNAFIFKYSPRPGTPAADWLDDVPEEEKRRRNQVLLADQDRRGKAANQRMIGSIQDVLVEGPSLRNPKRWSGRAANHKIVIFEPRATTLPGMLARIRIENAKPQTLYGSLI